MTDTDPVDTTSQPTDTPPTTEIDPGVTTLTTDAPPASDTVLDGIGGTMAGLFGYHHEMFYAMEIDFMTHFAGRDGHLHFNKLFDGTKNFNYRGYCEYFGITQAEFEAYWENIRVIYNQTEQTHPFDELFIMEHHYDEWFADDYASNPVFMATDTYPDNLSKTYIAKERSEDYTILYYTIDYMLVEAVGDTEFEKYLQTAEEINILTFLTYFDITKDEYLEIYKAEWLKPHNVEYLFSTDPAMIDEYFKVHKDMKIQ